MKLIRKRELTHRLSNEYLDGDMTIGECIDSCYTYDIDEEKICLICKHPKDCEDCPIYEEKRG